MAVHQLALLVTILVAIPVCHGEENILDLRNLGLPVVVPAVDYSKNTFLQTLISGNFSYEDVSNTLSAGLKDYKGSGSCFTDVEYILSGITNIYSPQFRYIDAASKIPHGILQGKFNWVGDYQECYSVPEISNPITKTTFKGNYFSGVVTLGGKGVIGPYPISIGMCLPDSCNATTATEFINFELSVLKANYSFIPKDLTVSMSKDEAPPFETGAIVMVVLSGILVSLVVMATLVDVILSNLKKQKEPLVMQSKMYDEPPSDSAGLLADDVFADDLQIQQTKWSHAKEKLLDVLLAFSFLRNSSKLLNTETAVGPLACLNGLRVLSMWWVILGHTYVFSLRVLDNGVELYKIVQRFSFQAIMNGTFSVDSFFFLSGLLVAYLALKEFLEKDRFNWLYYFLHRYWRLTPIYAYVIFCFAFFFNQILSGPFRTTLDKGFQASSDACKKYWFSNLLYINNFYPEHGDLGKICVGWSWYLANDMQFYLFISPIILILFMYVPKYLSPSRSNIPGIACSCFIIVACIVIRAVLVSYYGIYGLMSQPTKHTDDPMAKSGPLYGRPYARMSVYVVGMLTGVALAQSKYRIRIPRLLALIGWCVSIATALAVVYGQYYYNHHTNLLDPTHIPHMTMTQSVFYVSLSRTLWGMCLAWLVLACVSGNGGWVTQILSWKIWAPLGRLTYTAYLIHPFVIYGYYLNLLQPLHFSDWVMINIFLSCLVVTYAFSFVLSMFLEAPMLQLEKAILKFVQPRNRVLN